MNLGIQKRVAIITGSSQGIGKAIATALAREDAHVIICARTENLLHETAKEIKKKTNKTVLPIRTDLNEQESIHAMIEQAVNTFGTIDILINNTGGPPPMYFVETTQKNWKDAVTQLLLSIIACCYEVIPYMKKQNWGRIINMTSIAAKQPIEKLILSNSIRAGILGFTKTLSNELAGDNILVNAVCPGWTHTKRVEELALDTANKTGKEYEEIVQGWTEAIPLGRLAHPEEIADLVTFLASERASYITGSTIQVDGGYIKTVV